MIRFGSLFSDTITYIKRDKFLFAPFWVYLAFVHILTPYIPSLDFTKPEAESVTFDTICVLIALFLLGLVPKFFVLLQVRFIDGDPCSLPQAIHLFFRYIGGITLLLLGSLGVGIVLYQFSDKSVIGFVLFLATVLLSLCMIVIYSLYPIAIIHYNYTVLEAFRRVYYLCKQQWRVLVRLSFGFSFFMLVMTALSLGISNIPLLGPSVFLLIFQGVQSAFLVLMTLVLYRRLVEPTVLVELKDEAL